MDARVGHVRTRPRRGRLIGLVAAFGVSLALAGCSVFDACPAIGWINTVIVKLEGPTRNVRVVELCARGVCSVPAGSQWSTDEPVGTATVDPQQLATYTPDPSPLHLPYFASKIDDRTWEISTEMATPERVTLRALSPSGEVLAETEVTLDWVRVGGTERCGGPAEAGPVVLTVAS